MIITWHCALCFQLYIRMSRYSNFIPLSGIQWVDYMYFHRYTLGTFSVIAITIFYSKIEFKICSMLLIQAFSEAKLSFKFLNLASVYVSTFL